jgi:hypothetical protein
VTEEQLRFTHTEQVTVDGRRVLLQTERGSARVDVRDPSSNDLTWLATVASLGLNEVEGRPIPAVVRPAWAARQWLGERPDDPHGREARDELEAAAEHFHARVNPKHAKGDANAG